MPTAASDQSTYQVRLEWALGGLTRLAPADVVVVVDVLGLSSTVGAALEAGADEPLRDGPAEAVAARAAEGGAAVLLGGIRNAGAVAREVLRRQQERSARTSVALIAVGEPDAAEATRFAVEDLLGAGAVAAALADLGIDHCSPDAAVAAEGFRALRGAVRHLLTASATGREWDAAGRRQDVLAAAALDASTLVPVLDGDRFVAA